MIKKISCLTIILFSLCLHLYAQDTEEQNPEQSILFEEPPVLEDVPDEIISPINKEYIKVDGLENWTHDYDISGYLDGKYNLIIRSRDKAGNLSIDGPYNIFVDSKSDMPIVAISSPSPFMRVGGNFTIVGTASDDDMVDLVEVKLDDGEFQKAQGSQFWSFPLDISLLEDGSHKITARVSDINGIKGQEVSVVFNVDQSKPIISVNSHKNGEILSGRVVIRGNVEDKNGVSKLEYSLDGELYQILRLTGNASQVARDFSLAIDTKANEAGTSYVSLRSTDGTGSIGSSLFVYYSDNEKPDINIISPTLDESVNGFVTISGTVSDQVGLRSFISKIGNLEEEIDLVPGNPYWSKTFDLRGKTSAIINLSALDLSGNKEIINYRLNIDAKSDIPQLILLDFPNNTTVNNDDKFIRGISTDDDGIQAIEYAFDANEMSRLDSNGPFIVDLSNLIPGKHKVQLKAFDLNGVASSLYKYSFTILEPNELSEEGEVLINRENRVTFELDQLKTKINEQIIESQIVKDSLFISGQYSNEAEINKSEYNFSGTAEIYNTIGTLSLSSNGGTNTFDREIDVSALVDGQHFLNINISDTSGVYTASVIPFILDRREPKISIISPSLENSVEGIITVNGKVEDFINGGEIYFSKNSKDFVPVDRHSGNNFAHNIDLSEADSNPETFLFKVVDRAGNTSQLKPELLIDLESDKPVVAIEVPAENSTIRGDFEVTGLVFDDDAVSSIFYSFDKGEFIEIEGNNFYNIPFSIDDINDGIHEISVKAQDTGGVMSEVSSSLFLVSKAEPFSTLTSPTIDDYTKSIRTISGESFDENGIESVYISYDNGISYHEAFKANTEEEMTLDINLLIEKTISWSYSLDTKLPGDGTHSLLIKSIDKAGTVGISSTILNIDNTYPEIKLDSPKENGSAAGTLIIDGKIFDGTGVKSVISELKALDGNSASFIKEIKSSSVFREIIDVNSYAPGWYNLNITVTDFANNKMSETRNVQIISAKEGEKIEILFPEEGKIISGPLAIQGKLYSATGANRVVLKIDDEIYESHETDSTGLYSFIVDEDVLEKGNHNISVVSGDSGQDVKSNLRSIYYEPMGPWVQFTNKISGQYVSGRPMIEGIAGYSGAQGDKSKTVERIEVSLDNGRVFNNVTGKDKWKFRLETYDLPEGESQLLVRAHFKDGSSAVAKLFVNVDESAPQIDLFAPEENQKFNETVPLVGTASDENGLESVEVLIRKGSKESYEVPSFIQGLYVEFNTGIQVYGEAAIGFSFFDDVVKVQFQAGLTTTNPERTARGIILGVKLLANVLDIPFSYFFGYDWEFFSMSVALGARFDYYSQSVNEYSFLDPDGNPSTGVVIGAVLAQWEFAKFEIKTAKAFNTYSFFAEGALWFISSEVKPTVKPDFRLGLRIGLF